MISSYLARTLASSAGSLTLPVLLRGQADARAVGAAAMVRLAIGRGRRPGGLDQLADGQPAGEDLGLEVGDFAVRRHVALGHRVLPDQVLGRDLGAEVATLGPHVAVRQLEPCARESVLEGLVIGAEPLGDLAVVRVHLECHVGRGHHGGDQLAGAMRVGRLVLVLLVDRLPLLHAGGALHDLVIVIEQQPKIVLRPGVGRVRPWTLEARCDGVLAPAALVAAGPAETLEGNVRTLGLGTDQRGIARAVALAEGMAAGGERDGLLIVHRHAGEGLAHVARRLQRVGIAARGLRD